MRYQFSVLSLLFLIGFVERIVVGQEVEEEKGTCSGEIKTLKTCLADAKGESGGSTANTTDTETDTELQECLKICSPDEGNPGADADAPGDQIGGTGGEADGKDDESEDECIAKVIQEEIRPKIEQCTGFDIESFMEQHLANGKRKSKQGKRRNKANMNKLVKEACKGRENKAKRREAMQCLRDAKKNGKAEMTVGKKERRLSLRKDRKEAVKNCFKKVSEECQSQMNDEKHKVCTCAEELLDGSDAAGIEEQFKACKEPVEEQAGEESEAEQAEEEQTEEDEVSHLERVGKLLCYMSKKSECRNLGREYGKVKKGGGRWKQKSQQRKPTDRSI